MYLGDFSTGSTVFFKFTTVGSSGAPTSFSSGGITVYKNGSTNPDTTGITLTPDFNNSTGLNHVIVEMASTSTFYARPGEFVAVVSSGAVGTENIKSYTVASWSLRNYSASTGVPSVSIGAGQKVSDIHEALISQVVVSASAKTFYGSTGAFKFGKVLSQDSTSSTGVYTEALGSTST